MELSVEMKNSFTEEVRSSVKELIDLNQLESLEEFDAGLYISNIFERKLKESFDLKSMGESQVQAIRTFLWSSVYNNLEIEKYEGYIKSSLEF